MTEPSRRLTVVGLGPGGVDLLLPAARDALERADRRFARTEAHPAVVELRAEGLEFSSFDAIYDAAEHIGDVYAAIVDELIAVASSEVTVAYAVPGNPVAAERSVSLLRSAAVREHIDLEVIPGLSFAELAFARLGVDPLDAGVRIVDAHDPPALARSAGPVLIAQCDHPLVLSEVKLALLEHRAPDTEVTVLGRLGLTDEQIASVRLADLDRVAADHLTSIYVDAGPGDAALELTRLLELAARLRSPGGCPWDADQTHQSLRRYLLEEAYEVVEAVGSLPADAPAGPVDPDAYAALADELGDLLYQVVFHTVLASEAQAFDLADVARGIHDKLVRRHPHVFGHAAADTSADVMRSWEQIKKVERGSDSIVSGITPGLPALLSVHKLYRKAASIGLDPGDSAATVEGLRAALGDVEVAEVDTIESSLGELLAAAVAYARAHGIDAESALAGWARRFRRRFEALEALAADRDLDLAVLPPAVTAQLWDEAGHQRPDADAR